ncbi:MAG: hypothetical protein LE168_00220 [Endomicrobium sp.]|nr:hypothetical protein [Endomicrobium sp.]
MNDLSLGMTKQDVLKVVGKPNATVAQGGYEYLIYFLYDTGRHACSGIKRDYFVRLVDGVVESYGRSGDFDSTDSTIKVGVYHK